MANTNLGTAKKAKKDEFYTQWADIEREMNAYLEFDPDLFRGKTVLLPCDDPEWSNFTKFFALHFMDFGLKKLISTSYAPNSNSAIEEFEPTLFELESEKYDEDKSAANGKKFTLTPEDITGDGVVNIDDLQFEYLEGDGDFRSAEVTALRDEADIVMTNPPFSLFREFLAWLIEGEVQFSIIGNQNGLTYKEVFPLVSDNKVWLGKGFPGAVGFFKSPYDDTATSTSKVEGHIRVSGVQWFTNIEHGLRHKPLQLMTMEDNLRFSRHKEILARGYPKYDNYEAIEVGYTDAIPSDFDGLIGVPITFLNKYCPDQFEILGISKTWDNPSGLKTKIYPKQTQIKKNGERSTVGKLNDGAAIEIEGPGEETCYEVEGKYYIQMYARIFIRHRNPEKKDA